MFDLPPEIPGREIIFVYASHHSLEAELVRTERRAPMFPTCPLKVMATIKYDDFRISMSARTIAHQILEGWTRECSVPQSCG